MQQSDNRSIGIGALSPDGKYMWDGDAWKPLWLLSDEVVDAVRVCFGLVVTNPYLLAEGLLNQSWRLDTPDSRYVLRVSRPERLPEQVAYEHALIQALHTHVPMAVVPVSGSDGDTVQQWHTHILSLFPFVEGISGRAVALDARHQQAARILAQIHRTSIGLAFSQRPGWRAVDEPPRFIWPMVRAVLERDLVGVVDLPALFYVLDREVSELDAWLDNLSHSGQPLLRAPVHGDFNPRNVLFKENTLVAVIDWDHCRVEPLAWEVAQVGFGEPDSDPHVFFRWYLEAGGPLTLDDFELLGGFARMGMLSEVQWTLTSPDDLTAHATPQALTIVREVAAGVSWLRDRADSLRSP